MSLGCSAWHLSLCTQLISFLLSLSVYCRGLDQSQLHFPDSFVNLVWSMRGAGWKLKVVKKGQATHLLLSFFLVIFQQQWQCLPGTMGSPSVRNFRTEVSPAAAFFSTSVSCKCTPEWWWSYLLPYLSYHRHSKSFLELLPVLTWFLLLFLWSFKHPKFLKMTYKILHDHALDNFS